MYTREPWSLPDSRCNVEFKSIIIQFYFSPLAAILGDWVHNLKLHLCEIKLYKHQYTYILQISKWVKFIGQAVAIALKCVEWRYWTELCHLDLVCFWMVTSQKSWGDRETGVMAKSLIAWLQTRLHCIFTSLLWKDFLLECEVNNKKMICFSRADKLCQTQLGRQACIRPPQS